MAVAVEMGGVLPAFVGASQNADAEMQIPERTSRFGTKINTRASMPNGRKGPGD
jgi:hypothetical protein